jgi:hypothetical protein
MPPWTHLTRTQRQADRNAAQQAADESLARHLQSRNISVPENLRKRLESSEPFQKYRRLGDLQPEGEVFESDSGSGDFQLAARNEGVSVCHQNGI